MGKGTGGGVNSIPPGGGGAQRDKKYSSRLGNSSNAIMCSS